VVFTDRTLIEMDESRPGNLDEMARIGGVGAKKLESYGPAFLEVIAGEAAPMHPVRRKLAGRSDGELFDRLQEVQRALRCGEDGTLKPLSCTSSQLSKLVNRKPRSHSELCRFLGDRLADRFGAAFLEVLNSDNPQDG
jgi:ATP-dependent DNA helicase RecQ